jgi:hypothetical protein
MRPKYGANTEIVTSMHPGLIFCVDGTEERTRHMAKIAKTLSAAALASLIAVPLLAASDADAATCRTRKLNGTLLGAAGGALLGGVVTHGSTGPIVGGLGGAVVGREIGRSGCHKYSYRSSRYRSSYRSAPAAYRAAPRSSVRKVYYDQYGTPVAQEYYR